MKRNVHFTIFVLLIAADSLSLFGQAVENKTYIIPPDVPVMSPEAAAVIKYTDYPVEPSSGIPDITIPLYTIQTGDITLPITLTCHPSGLRPRENSGWIATGWTLNAAPSVVRKANGLPDELNWNEYRGFLHNDQRGSYDQAYLKKLVEKGIYDESQDDYYYQLPGGGGKLFMRQLPTYGFQMIPESDKEVQVLGTPQGGASFGRITDGNGIQYSFDGIAEISYYKSMQYPTRWLCTSIESSHYPQTSTIGFEYTDFVETYHHITSNLKGSMIVEDRRWKEGASEGSPAMTSRFIIDSIYGAKRIYWIRYNNGRMEYTDTHETMDIDIGYEGSGNPNGNNVKERKLKKINFPYGSVEFMTSGNRLQSIIVKNDEGKILKTVTLFTSRYNPYTELIKLDSVKIFDAGEGEKKYTLQYLDVNYVPAQTTQAIDHWGYFNGKFQNDQNAIPKGYFSTQTYSGPGGGFLINGIANRESDGCAMEAGMLSLITDPQGVSTLFDYEANKVAIKVEPFSTWPWNTNGEPIFYFKEVGGLRVVEVKVTGSNNFFKRIWYDYGITDYRNYGGSYEPRNEMEWGGGIAPLMVTIDDYCYTQTKNIYDENKRLIQTSRLRTFTTNPVTNITFPNGRTIIYTKVMERVFASGEEEKRTVYYYREPNVNPFTCILGPRITGDGDLYENFDFEIRYSFRSNSGGFFPHREQFYGSSDFYPPYPYDTYVENWYYKNSGKLYKKEEYTGDRLTYKEELHYPDRIGQPLPEGAVEIFPIEGYNGSHVIWGLGSYQSVIATTGSPALTEEWLDNQKAYLRGHLVIDKAGYMPFTKKTMTRYFTNGSSIVTTQDYEYLQTQRHKNPSAIITRASNGQYQKDQFGYTYIEPNMYKLSNHVRKVDEKEITTAVTFEGPHTKTISKRVDLNGENIYVPGEFVEQASYKYYKNNIINIKQLGQPEIGFIWSYRNQYPIAKLVNIPYSAYYPLAVALSNTDPTAQDFNTIKNLQASYPDAHITTYQYKPLAGITTISDPSGKTNRFVYDDLGRLRLQKDVEDKKVVEYEYRLAKYKNSGGSSIPNPPLIISFQHYQDQAPFILYSRANNFYIDIIGGSGGYKCKWKISATDSGTGQTDTYEQPDYVVNDNRMTLSVPGTTRKGSATVTCTVTDTHSSEQKTESFWFYYNIP